MQPVSQNPVRQIAKESYNRNAKEHAQNTSDASADGDRDDDPQGLQPGGISEDLRSQDETVKLLEHEDQDNEDHGFYRRDQEQDQCSGNCADKRTKVGNHVRNSHDHTDQDCVRQLEDGHQHEAQAADDRRVQRLPDNETAEQLIGFPKNLHDDMDMLHRYESIDYSPKGIFQRLLIGKHINGNDDGDDQIQKPLYDDHRNLVQSRDKISGKVTEIGDDIRQGIVDGRPHHLHVQLREMLFQVIHKVINIVDGLRNIIYQIRDAADDLRHNAEENDSDQSDYQKVSNRNGENFPKPSLLHVAETFQKPGHSHHRRIQDKGDEGADDEGHQDIDDLLRRGYRSCPGDKEFDNQRSEKDDSQGIDRYSEVIIVCLKAGGFFFLVRFLLQRFFEFRLLCVFVHVLHIRFFRVMFSFSIVYSFSRFYSSRTVFRQKTGQVQPGRSHAPLPEGEQVQDDIIDQNSYRQKQDRISRLKGRGSKERNDGVLLRMQEEVGTVCDVTVPDADDKHADDVLIPGFCLTAEPLDIICGMVFTGRRLALLLKLSELRCFVFQGSGAVQNLLNLGFKPLVFFVGKGNVICLHHLKFFITSWINAGSKKATRIMATLILKNSRLFLRRLSGKKRSRFPMLKRMICGMIT